MSPRAQSRDDTPPGGEPTCAKRHHSQTQGAGEGVKGRSRLAGARSAALEALALTLASSERRGSDREPRSVPAVTARRGDRRQRIEVEFNNGREGVGGRRAAQRLWQGFEPGGVGGLKRQQFGNRVVPALWPGPAIGRLARLHNNNWRLLVTVAVARLPFGVAQRGLAFG